VADLVFAFDPAIDRPLAVSDGMPAAVVDAMAVAPIEALRASAAAARDAEASAFVVFGRVLDPHRASPAQAAAVRGLIVGLAAAGCRTIWITDDAASCPDIGRMLGEPQGLLFVTPLAPLRLDLRGMGVEIVCAQGGIIASSHAVSALASLDRRVIVGWDTSGWSAERSDDSADLHAPQSLSGWLQPGCHCVWGSRLARQLPAGVHHAAAIQPRSPRDAAGACGMLSLIDVDGGTRSGDDRTGWRTVPTQRVAWQTLTVASTAGGDEELATTIWSALESLPDDAAAPLRLVRCAVECGTSVARRVRVAEIAAETLARIRELFDQRASRAWCHDIHADPGESLAPLGHARSGGRPGSTTSFTSALADIVLEIEHAPLSAALPTGLAMPGDMAREAGWLALELIESA
jgi:hypothetical protein